MEEGYVSLATEMVEMMLAIGKGYVQPGYGDGGMLAMDIGKGYV